MATDMHRLLASVFKSSREAILVSGPGHEIIIANPAAAAMAGYQAPEELIGLHTTDFFYDQADQDRVWNILLEKGFYENLELRLKRKDGSVIDVLGSTTIHRDEEGGILWVDAHFMDISERKKMERELITYRSDLEAIVSVRTAELQSSNARLLKENRERKQAENALARSEERYALAQRAAKIGSWDWDISTGQLHWSDTIEPIFGFQKGEFAGTFDAFLDCVYPLDRPRVVDAIAMTQEAGKEYYVEHRILWPDGSVHWVAETGDVVRDSRGRPVRMVGIVRDISLRRDAISALQITQHAIERAGDAIFWTGPMGNFLYANEAACRLLGYSRDELLAMKVMDIDVCMTEENWDAHWRAIKEQGAFTIETLQRTKGGREIPVEVTVNYFEFEGKEYNFAFVRDVTERKQSEEALRESEARWRSLAESSPDHILTLDAELNIQFVNYASPGLTVEELIGTPLYQYVEKERKEEIKNILTNVLKSKKPDRYETTYVAPDGGHIYYESFAIPRVLSDRVIGLTISARDITNRKEAEKALRESEERFRSIIENTTAGYFFIDSKGRYRDVNEAWLQMHGFSSAGEVIGKHFAFSQKEEDMEEARKIFDGIVRGDPAFTSGEFTRKRKEGNTGYHSFSARPVHRFGKLIGIEGFLIDITDRKLAEAALEESEKKFRNIVESSPMGMHMYRLEPDGRLVFIGANPAADRLLKLENRRFVGMTIEEAFPPLTHTEVPVRYREAAGQGTSWTTEQIAYEDNKIKGAFEVHAFQTSPGNMAAMFWDITDRKQAEEEHARLEERLRQAQKMEAIGTLAGGIAHDFNNILTGIQGYSEMLLMEFQPADPLRDQIQEILRAVEHASSLTRQLLAFSRKQMIQPVVMNLNKILANAKGMLGRIIQENIEIVYRPSRRSEYINVDPNQIHQVLVNLASNARDAMPFGGKLTFTTSRERLEEETMPAKADLMPGEYVRLTVQDTGRGMNRETLERAFDPFFTTKGRAEHSGMGLATVFGIVKQNKGAVLLDSAEFEGTTVTLYFPYVSGEKAVEEEVIETVELSGNETILLVEDEDMVRSMARRLLELKGYRVLDANNGQEAMRISRDHINRIHLLLTDVIMPNMNGKELYGRLRVTQPAMKVLFMSGYSEEFIAEFGILDDNAPFIFKPFKMDELARKVREVLDE